MARKRMIDPQIWASEDFSKLSNFAQLVWIGLFSNADDEGRGKAKSAYLKSILFPYSEDIKLIKKVDSALNEIAQNMSISFYKFDNCEYYQLENWAKWQKVDKPQASKIPAFDDENNAIRRLFDDCSVNYQEPISPNKKRIRIEENRKEIEGNNAHTRESFTPPSLEEVQNYALGRKSQVDPIKFYEFYEAGNWTDSKGQKVKNWKQKFITWENKEPKSQSISIEKESQLERAAKRLGVICEEKIY